MENGFGSSIDVLHEAFKIAHIYLHLFDEEFFMDSRQFSHYGSWIFPTPIFYMRIMQSENSATNIHAHYCQSETAPIYTRIIREKNFAPRYI